MSQNTNVWGNLILFKSKLEFCFGVNSNKIVLVAKSERATSSPDRLLLSAVGDGKKRNNGLYWGQIHIIESVRHFLKEGNAFFRQLKGIAIPSARTPGNSKKVFSTVNKIVSISRNLKGIAKNRNSQPLFAPMQ